jgi:hypothetical protein
VTVTSFPTTTVENQSLYVKSPSQLILLTCAGHTSRELFATVLALTTFTFSFFESPTVMITVLGAVVSDFAGHSFALYETLVTAGGAKVEFSVQMLQVTGHNPPAAVSHRLQLKGLAQKKYFKALKSLSQPKG